MTSSQDPTPVISNDPTVDRGAAQAMAGPGLTLYYCLATLGVSVAVVLVDNEGPSWLAVLCNLVMLSAWFLLGQPQASPGHPSTPSAWAYAAVAVVVVGIDSYVAPQVGSFILFVACPQIVVAMTFATSVVLIVAINAVFAASTILAEGSRVLGSTVVTATGVAIGVTYFSYRTLKSAEQSADRARLISQLQTTREEAAELRAEQAVSGERVRISREVHDTVAQGFASILMLTQALDAEIAEYPDQARRHADMVKRVAAESLEESRRLVSALAPAPLDELSLNAAIVDLARRFRDETGIEVQTSIVGDPFTPEKPLQVVALRFCQETLANVRKHARASLATIAISYGPDRLVVRVTDDGRGFDGRGYGYGLRGLMTRVEEIHGSVSVDSSPGRGTTVTARLPVGPQVVSHPDLTPRVSAAPTSAPGPS